VTASVEPLKHLGGPADAATAATADGPALSAALDGEVRRALRNAAKLGLSLVGTWGIAFAVRVLLPRQLGPELFGAFQFADAVAVGLFILASFGIETYIRKEIATRREHASDFYGGLLVLRLVVGVLLVAGALVALDALGKPPLVLRLVLLLTVTQIFATQNATTTALLHAVGKVDGLSIVNVVAKILWCGGIVAGLAAGYGVQGVAAAMLAAEVLKVAALEVLVRRHLAIRLEFNARATLAALAGSLPFFAMGLSNVLYAKIDVAMLSFLAGDREVGWYGAASGIAGMALLLAPLIMWVLLPLTARAGDCSPAEVTLLTRRAMSFVLAIATPITLLLALGADVIVDTLFGPAFGPSTRSLRTIAPVFLLTYVGMVSGATLMAIGRGWLVTSLMLLGVVVSPFLHWLLIPRFLEALGPGGAGVGAAVALNLTEVFITVAMTIALGSHAFDRASVVRLAKSAAACAVVVAADRLLLAPIGAARLVVDAALYGTLVVLWRAVDLQTVVAVIRRTDAPRAETHAEAA
jgi:O-antigen/teichoic acid export membrane protein